MRPIYVRAGKEKKQIRIVGKKDPRDPDNTVEVWLDDQGRLHIAVQKPLMRCYQFKEMIDSPSHVEIVQV